MRDWAQYAAIIGAMRGGAGESTIRESGQIGADTKAKMQAWQAVFLAVAIVCVFAGLYAVGWSVLRVYHVSGIDGGSITVGVVIALVGGIEVIQRLIGHNLTQRVVNLLGVLGALLATGVFVSMIIYVNGHVTAEIGVFAIGAAVFYAGLLLAQNMVVQLVDPFGWTTPFEREITPSLIDLLESVGDQIKADIATDQESGSGTVERIEIWCHIDDNHEQLIDIPLNGDQLAELARGMLEGRPFSENEWARGDDRLMSQKRLVQVRSAMIEAGWLQWRNGRNPTEGVELTALGEKALAEIVRQM